MKKQLLTLTALTVLASVASGQAYCALRDPNKQIFGLFPEADSYQSVVRTIDESARRQVGEVLPFTLHFNELGRHTVYIPQKDGEALGFVHVRSEASRWGLIEVAWGFNLQLEITGYEFQRCRDRSKSVLETDEARAKIAGLNFEGLSKLMKKDGSGLAPGALDIDPKANDLALALIKNGLKTIATTQIAWGDDVWDVRAEEYVRANVEGYKKIDVVENVYTDSVVQRLEVEVGAEGFGFDRDRSRAWTVTDKDGQWMCSLLATRWAGSNVVVDLIWMMDESGKLQSVAVQGTWPKEDIRQAFEQQLGQTEADLSGCAGPVELAALEVLISLKGTKNPSAK